MARYGFGDRELRQWAVNPTAENLAIRLKGLKRAMLCEYGMIARIQDSIVGTPTTAGEAKEILHRIAFATLGDWDFFVDNILLMTTGGGFSTADGHTPECVTRRVRRVVEILNILRINVPREIAYHHPRYAGVPAERIWAHVDTLPLDTLNDRLSRLPTPGMPTYNPGCSFHG